MVSLIQSYWELIAGNYYGWTEGKLVLLCHISMAGINERIFQFKTLLDKGVYYFGPRTVAKCTIRIKMYSESLVCSFFSNQYNLLPKISILRSSKRNINIWKNQLHNITRASAFYMHNYVNLFCIGNRITQSGKNQCVAEERIRVEVLWNIKQNVKDVCNNYHFMGITFIEQFNWFRKFKALMLFNVTLKLLQNFCLQEKKVGNIFFLKQKCRRGNAIFFLF